VLWKELTAFLLIIQKLSSTYRFYTLGVTGVVLIAISSIASIPKLATTGLTGLPMAQPWICLKPTHIFLLHKNIVHIILKKNKEICRKEKKYSQSMLTPTCKLWLGKQQLYKHFTLF